MQQAIGTELLNDCLLLYHKKEPTHVVPSSHSLSQPPAPVVLVVPPLPSPVRIALLYCPRCRPSNHVPTLPHTDPVCSPVASRVSSPLLQRREASHRPCVRSLRYRVLGACGVCGDTNDLEARTHSRVRPHTGPQCVFLPASRPPPASRTSVLRPSSLRALSFVLQTATVYACFPGKKRQKKREKKTGEKKHNRLP